jgi:hypothetical protein
MPPTERSPAELTLARHLARAMEDLLTVTPIELALTETIGVLLPRPRRVVGRTRAALQQSGLRRETIGSGLGP